MSIQKWRKESSSINKKNPFLPAGWRGVGAGGEEAGQRFLQALLGWWGAACGDSVFPLSSFSLHSTWPLESSQRTSSASPPTAKPKINSVFSGHDLHVVLKTSEPHFKKIRPYIYKSRFLTSYGAGRSGFLRSPKGLGDCENFLLSHSADLACLPLYISSWFPSALVPDICLLKHFLHYLFVQQEFIRNLCSQIHGCSSGKNRQASRPRDMYILMRRDKNKQTPVRWKMLQGTMEPDASNMTVSTWIRMGMGFAPLLGVL